MAREIIRSPGDLQSNITFPELVGEVGGKAAGLLWIQKHRPDIPTAKMVVATPGISVEQIAAAAKEADISFPWIVRASTKIDNIPGYEDAFETRYTDEEHATYDIHSVKYSPANGFYRGLYDFEEATVIVAQKTESDLVGTLIEHPHQDRAFYANVDNVSFLEDVKHAAYSIIDGTVIRLKRRSLMGHETWIPEETDRAVGKVAQLYKDIISLPGLDPNMTYQLEFCPNPFLVYQIRDFLPRQKADFQLVGIEDSHVTDGVTKRIVFGITPEDGVLLRVREYHESWLETKTETETHTVIRHMPWAEEPPGGFVDGENLGVVIEMRKVERIRFPRYANLFSASTGMLAHGDIRAIRTSPITVVNNGDYMWYSGKNKSRFNALDDGDMVRLTSDGLTIQLKKLRKKS